MLAGGSIATSAATWNRWVIDHVQHRAGGVVELGPVVDVQRLRHVDLHGPDVLGAPRVANRLLANRSTCRSWVRLLAEEVVDPEDLLLLSTWCTALSSSRKFSGEVPNGFS